MTPELKLRSPRDRRCGWDRRALTPTEKSCLAICEEAGVFFKGVQSGFDSVPDQMLFQKEELDSTLCLPVDHFLTAHRVLQKIRDAEKSAQAARLKFYGPYVNPANQLARTGTQLFLVPKEK
ncbi:MAG: hypothetical protein ACRD20_19575 [Terriglobales bacterium]